MFYSIIRLIVYPLVRLLFWVKITGRENIPKDGKVIICCNHISMIDVAALVIACPRPIHFMAKSELFKNKLLAWFLRKMNAFAVIRGSSGKDAIDHAVSLVKNGGILGIFPEGKRYHEGRPTKAKSGIAVILSMVDAPVIPTAICYKTKPGIFCRAELSFGEPMKHELLEMKDNSRDELRRVSNTIMGGIIAEWEKLNG